MNRYQIKILADAEQDLAEIVEYLKINASPAQTISLLGDLEQTVQSLSQLPLRGHLPPELARININRYNEIHCHSYRIIYEVERKTVLIHAVLDCRRDIQDTLTFRLLR